MDLNRDDLHPKFYEALFEMVCQWKPPPKVREILYEEQFGGYTSETVDKALLDLPEPLE